jgi:hypothetical protein
MHLQAQRAHAAKAAVRCVVQRAGSASGFPCARVDAFSDRSARVTTARA